MTPDQSIIIEKLKLAGYDKTRFEIITDSTVMLHTDSWAYRDYGSEILVYIQYKGKNEHTPGKYAFNLSIDEYSLEQCTMHMGLIACDFSMSHWVHFQDDLDLEIKKFVQEIQMFIELLGNNIDKFKFN